MTKKIDSEAIVRSARASENFLKGLHLLLWLVGIAAIAIAIKSPSTLKELLIGNTAYRDSQLNAAQMLALTTLALSQLLLWGLAIRSTKMSFAQVASDKAGEAANSAARAATYLWVGLAWSVIAEMPFSVIATWNYPVGERVLAVELSWTHFAMLFVALIIGFYSKLLSLGAELWQDHKEII